MASTASVNHWPESKCAKAFWSQQQLLPYRRLLTDTCNWLDPQPGERWLDLGSGSGQLTRALWEKSGGTLAELVALDCAQANERSVRQLHATLQPAPGDRLRFCHADFSAGLAAWQQDQLDGITSGLAIQYAEYFCEKRGCWTTDAYDRLLAEVYRVLRPGGRFVFSVNVPNPSWTLVALYALPGLLFAPQLTRFLKNCLRMWSYGCWLKREANRGRFHYLSVDQVLTKLTQVGFTAIEHRRSFAWQAYIFRCRKPEVVSPENRSGRRAAA
jgi:ubiquinone/menaquinone biosynthesis C-methylase UbiE